MTLQNKYRDYSKYIDPEDMLLYAGVVLCMHGQSCVFNFLLKPSFIPDVACEC